jgi:hypothetical protein
MAAARSMAFFKEVGDFCEENRENDELAFTPST